jgi:diaminopimelate decarboxylase
MYSRLCEKHEIKPRTLVIGSGFGIPYSEKDVPLDIRAVGSRIVQRVDAFKGDPRFDQTELVLEVGRYIVGESGVFLTRIVNTKLSRGIRIAVCDGGMNNHLAAAGHMGSVIHRNYPMFKVGSDVCGSESPQPQLIYGPLCTSIDLLANQVLLPPLLPGDLLAICSSGAYGLTSSPIGFISHPPCGEVLIEKNHSGFAVIE